MARSREWHASRRTWLLASGGLLLGGGGLLAGAFAGRGLFVGALRRRLVPRVALDRSAAPGPLREEEAGTLEALGRILAAPGHRPAPGFFADHARRRAATGPGYLAVYRDAARWLDALAQERRGAPARFAELTLEERDAILAAQLRLPLQDETWRGVLEALWSPTRTRALRLFRKYVVRDLLWAYYESPFGWQVVGYTHFPGTPAGDPLDYTRAVGS